VFLTNKHSSGKTDRCVIIHWVLQVLMPNAISMQIPNIPSHYECKTDVEELVLCSESLGTCKHALLREGSRYYWYTYLSLLILKTTTNCLRLIEASIQWEAVRRQRSFSGAAAGWRHLSDILEYPLFNIAFQLILIAVLSSFQHNLCNCMQCFVCSVCCKRETKHITINITFLPSVPSFPRAKFLC
jgi:hypothetical protein